MKKILVTGHREEKKTSDLLRLLEILFPECEIEIVPTQSNDRGGLSFTMTHEQAEKTRILE